MGRRLFQADSDGRLVKMIIMGPEQSPREANSAVPEALDRACMRALASEPADRYASAADFAMALEQAAESDGFSIATTRAVAAFVELTRAHKKLDPKELAALKRGSPPEASAEEPPSSPSAKASSSSVSGSAVLPEPSVAERGADPVSATTDGGPGEPSPAPEEEPPIRSAANEASSVTTTEHTISGAREPLPVPRRRTGVMIGVLAAAAAAVSVAGLLLSRGDDTAATAPASDVPTGTAAAPLTSSAETPPMPSSEPSVAPSVVAPEASAPPAAPSASAQAVAELPKTQPERPATQPRPPVTKPTKPQPGSTTYNPPQL
ncbi:MAG: hypothetical protein DRI90_08850 [Deltaproteobacteria bacterium]|nr:MAG: hypothetical protein DRI90_08850 [Deltaproteobacteria bacterium]